MTYGAITQADARVLEAVLLEFKDRPMKFLEIGVYNGGTARGVRDFCKEQNIALEYYGIEAGILCVPTVPFPEAHFVIGESREVFMKVPNDLDVVLVDGDHTFNAVVLDTVHYSRKVKPSGFMVYHDTAPHVQHKLAEPNRNYPEHPWFHNAVNDALNAVGFPFRGWKLWLSGFDSLADYGGTTAYRLEI